jgi:biopolymer transport protein TolR
MAFSGMASNGARGRGRWRNSTSLAEMNVVPLVDVMLVLLIIFMVTASAMEFGLEIQVPKVKSASHSVQDAPVVSISRDGKTYLKERPTNVNQLSAAIKQQFRDAKDVYVKSDKNVRWEQLAQIVATLGEAKLNVKLVTQAEDIHK